ncbi:hypothetical protein MINTM005_13120 [Mycobacterium intracellulare]|uniref:hypothetical protein n=1 Tax=Mycobacterium intracellulare TaxID=1767 RepID=UPI001927710F|nr:hypothetical protein [Mycobacterium intracellulare]BCO56068.1 hypothetical protein MINTM005_13120 [Mycobacterium intracellulare]
MTEISFRATEIVCTACGEHLYIGRHDDELQIQQQHVDRHEAGKCARCGHWRDEHAATAQGTRDYLNTSQGHCCWHPYGMGDFCGCAGDEKVQNER